MSNQHTGVTKTKDRSKRVERDQKTTSAPVVATHGKVIDVSDIDVNMTRPTEDLLSVDDNRADAVGGGSRTEFMTGPGALPKDATSTLGTIHQQSSADAITGSPRKSDGSSEKDLTSSGGAHETLNLRSEGEQQGARKAMLGSEESARGERDFVVNGDPLRPMATDVKVWGDPAEDNEGQTNN